MQRPRDRYRQYAGLALLVFQPQIEPCLMLARFTELWIPPKMRPTSDYIVDPVHADVRATELLLREAKSAG